MRFSNLKLNKIKKLPESCGVYCFKKNKEILYIGKAINIRERVKNHFGQPGYRDYLFLDKVKKIGYLKTDSEIEALILEAKLIKKYQPKYNVIWRDDKNYFFVAKTKEDFPRVFWTHQTKVKKILAKKQEIETEFIGPFVDGKALKQTLKALRKVFPYRSCFKTPNRPCLWYHLGRCLAPCLLKSKFIKEIPVDSLKIKKLSRKNAENLMKTLREGKNPVLKKLKKEMKAASKNQDFETAAKIRDQIGALERVMEHAKIFEPQFETLNWPEVEKKLNKFLKIKNKISRIEAYDVSNIVGKLATGSMVTFINGLPDKNSYRKFKIKFSDKPNDVAMIKEILTRRFKHSEWPYPDLILIDGGKAQLNVAIKSKSQSASRRTNSKKIKIIALAKRKNELFVESQEKPILLKNLPREVFNLILQLRDEAHRFAITYHKKLRELDLYPKS